MTQKPNNLKSLYLTDPKEPIAVLSCPQLGLEETIIETILDTGFNGELALPHILIQGSDLEKDLVVDDIDLASGSTLAYFSNLEIIFLEKKFLVEVCWLPDPNSTPLLGSGFFAKYSEYFKLDYKKGKIEIKLTNPTF